MLSRARRVDSSCAIQPMDSCLDQKATASTGRTVSTHDQPVAVPLRGDCIFGRRIYEVL